MQVNRTTIRLGVSVGVVCVLCLLVWLGLYRDQDVEDDRGIPRKRGPARTEPAKTEANYSPYFRGVSLRFVIVSPQETYYVGLPIDLKAVLTNHSDNVIVTNPAITNSGRNGINLHVNYEASTGEHYVGAKGIPFAYRRGGWNRKDLKPAEALEAHWTFVPILPGTVQLRAYYHHTKGNGYWVNSREITVSDNMAPEMQRTYGELAQRLKEANPQQRSDIYAELAEKRHVFAARFLSERLPFERDPKSREALVRSMCKILATGAGFESLPVFFALAQDRTEVSAIRCMGIGVVGDMSEFGRYTDPWTGDTVYLVPDDLRAKGKNVIAALVSDPSDAQVSARARQWMKRLAGER
jgi:hypothetical protein